MKYFYGGNNQIKYAFKDMSFTKTTALLQHSLLDSNSDTVTLNNINIAIESCLQNSQQLKSRFLLKSFMFIAIICFAVSKSFAANQASSKEVNSSISECRFRNHEWQIDSSVVGQICAHGAGLGGNVGVSYFWSKYFGIGLDDSIVGHKRWNTVGAIGVDTLQGNLFFRYPLCSWNLAPYIMLGGGGIWGQHSQGVGNLGGGVEYRLTQNIGCFMDCRWLYGTSDFCDSSSAAIISMTLTRVGVRFAF